MASDYDLTELAKMAVPEVVTHIAGADITICGRWLRQRCSWCGTLIVDYDLSLTASSDGKGPSTWKCGSLVDISGVNPVHSCINPDEKLPDTFCGTRDTFDTNPVQNDIKFGHTDVPPNDLIKYDHCATCLHVRPYNGWTRECKGPGKLSLRTEEAG